MKIVFQIIGKVIRFLLFISCTILAFVFEILAQAFKALKSVFDNH